MGTQQVLLIVLSVIIVGVAVGVGITMFSKQSSSTNREAMTAGLEDIAAQALAFYKTPASMAGGGKGNPGFGANRNEAIRTVGRWIGFDANGYIYNDYGYYRIWNGYGSATTLNIGAIGKEQGQNPNLGNWWGGTGRIQIHLQITPETSKKFTFIIYN